MTTQTTFATKATKASADKTVFSPDSVEGSERRRVPFVIPTSQVYYWRRDWQRAEREGLRDLKHGDFLEFSGDDPEDAARWLDDPDTD